MKFKHANLTVRKRIVVAQGMDLFPDQIERLKNLGEVKIYDDLAKTSKEWLDRCYTSCDDVNPVRKALTVSALDRHLR